jgi:hypothetical protein
LAAYELSNPVALAVNGDWPLAHDFLQRYPVERPYQFLNEINMATDNSLLSDDVLRLKTKNPFDKRRGFLTY